MFRRLMAIETEAVRRHARDASVSATMTTISLTAPAEELIHCFPTPWHFGTCSSRHEF